MSQPGELKIDLKIRQRQPRRVNVNIPPSMLHEFDLVKDACQEAGMSLSKRQRIGSDGVILSVLTWLLAQPDAVRVEVIKKGYSELKSKLVPDSIVEI